MLRRHFPLEQEENESMKQTRETYREAKIAQWFCMWLDKQDTGICELFSPDALYIESWGPQYRGSQKIKLWFDEWNTRGTVRRWDILQLLHDGEQTVVQWSFNAFSPTRPRRALTGSPSSGGTRGKSLFAGIWMQPRAVRPLCAGRTPCFRIAPCAWL